MVDTDPGQGRQGRVVSVEETQKTHGLGCASIHLPNPNPNGESGGERGGKG